MLHKTDFSKYEFFCKETTEKALDFLKDIPLKNPHFGYEVSGSFTVEIWNKKKKLNIFFNRNNSIDCLVEDNNKMTDKSIKSREDFMLLYKWLME